MTRSALAIMFVLAFGTPAAAADDEFFHALAKVEGVHGKKTEKGAVGPYQIHFAYWLHATEHNPYLRSKGWYACENEGYARQVVVAYFHRVDPKAWERRDYRRCAMLHNAGKRGCKLGRGIRYGNKVMKVMYG